MNIYCYYTKVNDIEFFSQGFSSIEEAEQNKPALQEFLKENGKDLKLILSKQLLGAELMKLRNSKNISKYQIRKQSSLQYSAIDAIEKGSSSYTIDSLLEYCLALDIKINLEL